MNKRSHNVNCGNGESPQLMRDYVLGLQIGMPKFDIRRPEILVPPLTPFAAKLKLDSPTCDAVQGAHLEEVHAFLAAQFSPTKGLVDA